MIYLIVYWISQNFQATTLWWQVYLQPVVIINLSILNNKKINAIDQNSQATTSWWHAST